MPSTKTMIISLVSVLALFDGVFAGYPIAVNNLNFPIFCHVTEGEGGPSSPIVQVAPGKVYKEQRYLATPNGPGMTLKCGTTYDEAENHPVQLAMSVTNEGRTHYQISSLNGHGFDPYDLKKYIPAQPTCDYEFCPAGFPCRDLLHSCQTYADVHLLVRN